MPIEVSPDRVSHSQRSMLAEASAARSSIGFLVHQFDRLALDDDLRSGRESLHPEWLAIYKANRSRFEDAIPAEMLERFDAVFSAAPIDEGVGSLDPSRLRVAFLFGAGASNPEPSGIPVTRELLNHLFERAQRANRDEVLRVAEFCKENKIDNIEDLLTALQIATFCSRNPTILKMTDYLLYRNVGDERGRRGRPPEVASIAFIQDTFQVLFGSLSGIMLPAKPNPCHEAVAKFVNAHPDCAIVTTNYDCCMDLALGDPGEAFSYIIPFSNHPELEKSTIATQLIKLHGSLNWFYCETCQQVQLIDIRKAAEAFERDDAPFPVIGICSKCSGQRRGLAVPPLAMKFDFFPPLTPLLGYAQEAFQNADLVVAIGYSFADADLYISRMISKSMQASTGQKLLIVDRTSAVADKMRRKLTLTIPNFDKSRVLGATGDCADLMPKLLGGELQRTRESELDVVSQVGQVET